jgi:hypothetical protein
MRIVNATTADTQLQRRALRERSTEVPDQGTSSVARARGISVEGELGTWHERDAVDPAIPDISVRDNGGRVSDVRPGGSAR